MVFPSYSLSFDRLNNVGRKEQDMKLPIMYFSPSSMLFHLFFGSDIPLSI
jgi:hypothetical protein